MATTGHYCRYDPPSILPLHRQHGLPLQLQTARRGRGRRRPSLQVAASASGAQVESVKAATDAEFFQPSDTRSIMLFDGVCNLCNGGIRFVRENDPNRSIRYIPLQSESGRKFLQRSGRAPNDISSVVLVEKDRSYIKSEAVLSNGVPQPAFPSARHLPQVCPSVYEGLCVRQCCKQPIRSVWPLRVRSILQKVYIREVQ